MNARLLVVLALGWTQAARAEVACPVSERSKSRWERAKRPGHAKYCDLVGAARLRVHTDPNTALRLAEQAESIFPSEIQAKFVRGRALAKQGQSAQAVVLFDALERAGQLSDPQAVHAYARTLYDGGELVRAEPLYVRASAALSGKEREEVLVELATLLFLRGEHARAEGILLSLVREIPDVGVQVGPLEDAVRVARGLPRATALSAGALPARVRVAEAFPLPPRFAAERLSLVASVLTQAKAPGARGVWERYLAAGGSVLKKVAEAQAKGTR